jgi:hypothetical protein
MIVPKLALFQVYKKFIRSAAAEFSQSPLSKTPEVFFPINVRLPPRKFVLAVEHPAMFAAVQYQSAIRPPSIGVNG